MTSGKDFLKTDVFIQLAARGVFRLGRCYIFQQSVPGLWASNRESTATKTVDRLTGGTRRRLVSVEQSDRLHATISGTFVCRGETHSHTYTDKLPNFRSHDPHSTRHPDRSKEGEMSSDGRRKISGQVGYVAVRLIQPDRCSRLTSYLMASVDGS